MIKQCGAPAMAAFLAGCLCACGPRTPPPVAGCDMVEAHRVAFSTAATADQTAGDTIEARSFGPDCANAVVSLVVRAGDGAPLYAFAAPGAWTFPETVLAAADPEAEAQAMRALLRRWARTAVATTADEPRWASIASGPAPAPPAEEALQAPWSTTFDAATFADIRARALPMACFETSPDSAQCVYWEPAAAQALPFLAFNR